MEEIIIKEYIQTKNSKKTARKLHISPRKVINVLRKECGPLYGLRGLCRLYLLAKDKCFMSATEARERLGTTKQNVYFLLNELTKHAPIYKLAIVKVTKRSFLFIVKHEENCIKNFLEYVKTRFNVSESDVEWR